MKVVFIHGSGSYKGVWRYQIGRFQDGDALTLPGHPEGQTCQDVEEYADWVREYIMGKAYEDVVLCGQSLGGAIALMYALNYPGGLKGIIIINSAARFTKRSPLLLWEREEAVRSNPRPWFRRLEQLFQFTPVDFMCEVMGKMIAMGPSVGLNDVHALSGFDILDRLHEIELPALIIHGDWDTNISMEMANELAKGLPKSKLVFIPQGTHFVFAEKPDLVNKAIEDFLNCLS